MKAFTIDFDGNNFKNDPLLLKCVERIKKVFGEENFTVYTKNDDIVKEALEKYKDVFEEYFKDLRKAKLSIACDFIKIYILSKQRDTVYIDPDVYPLVDKIPEEYLRTNLKDSGCLSLCFCLMYSGITEQSEQILLNLAEELKNMYKQTGRPISDVDILRKKPNIIKQDKSFFEHIHFSTHFLNNSIKFFLYSKKFKGVDYYKENIINKYFKGKNVLIFVNSKNFFYDDFVFNLHNVVSYEWLKTYLEKTTTRFIPGRKVVMLDDSV